MKKNYTKQEVAEMNVLDVLDKNEEFSKRGINFNEIFSKFKFDQAVKIYNLPSELEKKGWIKRDVLEIKITKKGKKAIDNFFSKANKGNRKEFLIQRPIEYQLAYKINLLEIFIGFFCLSIILLGVLTIISYFGLLSKGGSIGLIFSLIFVIIFILFIFSILIFSISMWTIISRSIGFFIRPLSFKIAFYLEENSDKVGKIITLLFFIAGLFIVWKILGILALVGGLILGLLIRIIENPDWMPNFFEKIVKKQNKK